MLSVSIAEFRRNLSEYLKLAEYKGESIRIVDEKRSTVVACLNPAKEENVDEYITLVKNMRGVFKDLPEDRNREKMKSSGIKNLNKLKNN